LELVVVAEQRSAIGRLLLSASSLESALLSLPTHLGLQNGCVSVLSRSGSGRIVVHPVIVHDPVVGSMHIQVVVEVLEPVGSLSQLAEEHLLTEGRRSTASIPMPGQAALLSKVVVSVAASWIEQLKEFLNLSKLFE
jgi:hypothetical protein